MARGMWRFGVLGPLLAERDGVVLPLTSGRQRALLAALLAARGVPMSRDRLIEELWGERSMADAGSTLHVHLSKLRERFGDLIVREPSGYRLAADQFTLDAAEFQDLHMRARSDPDQASALLGRALGLFRADPLCDVAPEGIVGEWRRELEEQRLAAQVCRMDAELRAGAGRELVAELDRLVGVHPFEERLWAQLMLALYRADRQADALEAFQRARRLFAAELGLTPGEPLLRLHQQILDHSPSLSSAAATVSLRVAPPAPTRSSHPGVPRGATPLVGRENELGALHGALADPDVRMLTITGPGGVGKTRLALELGEQQESSFAEGALFVGLERVTDPALIATEIATALSRRDATTALGADELLGVLRHRELLLVLDNFEHLLGGAPFVAELMANARRLRVVLTSRAALHIRGEHVFELEPLPVPVGDDDAAASPAVALFLQCAIAANRKLQIDVELINSVGGICRALDGLPLAIELAASRCGTLAPATIVDQLSRPLDIGEHGLRDLPERQQTLRDTIAWSYELLSAEAQTAFRAAGVFLGGFSAGALAAVLGRPVSDALHELQEASLVQHRSPARHVLLDLVRAFALEMLESRGEADARRGAHRSHFARTVEPISAAFSRHAAVSDLAAQLWPEHANLRAALLDAIERDDADAATVLALGLRPLWHAGNLAQESGEMVDAVLERFTLEPMTELALLRTAAAVAPRVGVRQRRYAIRAAELGNRDEVGLAVVNEAGRAVNARDTQGLARLRPTLYEILSTDFAPRIRGWVHYLLSADSYIDERYGEALEHAKESAAVAEEIGHEHLLTAAAVATVLARSAVHGVLTQPDVAGLLAGGSTHGVDPTAVASLWFAARYAASIDPATAEHWLVRAEHVLGELGHDAWPECVLREETMAALGITDLSAAVARTPRVDTAAAVSDAFVWMSRRDPAETAPRAVVPVSMIAGSTRPVG